MRNVLFGSQTAGTSTIIQACAHLFFFVGARERKNIDVYRESGNEVIGLKRGHAGLLYGSILAY
jgi:hypothetical protein